MTYSYDEEPKKYKAELSAKDRKIDYLEELVRTGIEQQKKWQKLYFEMKEKFEETNEKLIRILNSSNDMENSNRQDKDIRREDMQ